MARLGKFVQTSNEQKLYNVDYTNWLDTGETIVSATYTIIGTTTPPLTVPIDSINVAGNAVAFYVAGGLTGNSYKVVITVETDNQQTKEDFVAFVIEDID